MYFFSIKDNYINISSNILGGSENLKIYGVPKPNNVLKLISNDDFKIKEIHWQVKSNNKWETDNSGYEYLVDENHIGKELRLVISYYDEDGFLDNLFLPYFNVSNNNTFNLPNAEIDKEYTFSFGVESDEEIVLDSEWLSYESKDNIVTLKGTPKYSNDVNFYIKKNDDIYKSFIINVKTEEIDLNKKHSTNMILNKPKTEILVDNLYVFNIKTKNVGSDIKFNVDVLPSWLNFIDNKDNTAIISGIANIDNIGENNISITASYGNFYDKLEFSIKVVPDRTLPIIKELKPLSDATSSKYIYYHFSSSKSGTLVFEGNIKSNTKIANMGSNKILLETPTDGIYSGSIKVKDSNRNISKPLIIKSFKVDRARPKLEYVHIESNGKNPNYAKLDDTITIKIKANKEIKKPTIVILNKLASTKKISKTEYEATYKVALTSASLKTSFRINFVDYLKTSGLEVTEVTDNSFVEIDTKEPKLNSVKLYTSNENKLYGIINDIINIDLEANEPITNPDIRIFGENVSLMKVSDIHYVGRYIIKDSTNKDNNLLKIDYEDLAGNKGNTVMRTTDNSFIEINTEKLELKELSTINFTINPEVTIEFESSDNGVIVGFNRIKSNTLTVSKGINSLKLEKLDNGTYNNAKIFVKNDIGNVSELLLSEFTINSNEIIPAFDDVFLTSNGNKNDLEAGNIVTLYFKTNKPINYPIVTFKSGEFDVKSNITLKNLSELEWSAEYIVNESDNFGSIKFTVEIFDIFNLNNTTDETSDGSYLLYNKESISFIKNELNNINNRINDIREDVLDCYFKTQVLNNRLDTVEEFDLIKKLNLITKENKVISLVGDEVSVLSNTNDNLSEIKYQWQRKGPEDELWENIDNENKSNYLIRKEDVNYNLRTKVTFSENGKEQMMFPNNIYVLNKNDQIWNFLQA